MCDLCRHKRIKCEWLDNEEPGPAPLPESVKTGPPSQSRRGTKRKRPTAEKPPIPEEVTGNSNYVTQGTVPFVALAPSSISSAGAGCSTSKGKSIFKLISSWVLGLR